MPYVYEHWRPDLNLPFWVGKGSGSRSHIFRRNKHYNNIVRKLKLLGLEAEVVIIADNLNDEEAFDLEKKRIEIWRLKNAPLTNQADGGKGGMSGCKRSEESKAKQSATTTGRKLSEYHARQNAERARRPEMRALVSAIHTGRKRPKETGIKISAAVKAHWADPEIRARKLAAIPIQKFSEETRAKMRAAKTPESRAKISAAVKTQWNNPEFRKLMSDTMKRTNAARRSHTCTG